MIITVDGPSASGKGTLSKQLAQHFSLPSLDTGLLYRALALDLLLAAGTVADTDLAVVMAADVDPSRHPASELRTLAVGEAASVVSALPAVRQALLRYQKDFANRPGGAVLDGRDCGTVIAPHAERKIFVTAASETRAQRRHGDLVSQGLDASFDDVLADIRRRDERDSGRSSAPLTIPVDALVLDTTEMDVAQMFDAVIDWIGSRDRRPA